MKTSVKENHAIEYKYLKISAIPKYKNYKAVVSAVFFCVQKKSGNTNDCRKRKTQCATPIVEEE